MAEKKRRGSGFDVEPYGEVIPEGTKFKKNKDGTLTRIPPKKKKKTTKTAK